MLQAKTFEEIEPLIALVEQGKLFDVQQWIADGKPINPPAPEPKKPRKWGPLEEALATGFHSMIQILLEAGANLTEPGADEWRMFNALQVAVQMNRLDLVMLLAQHGADFEKLHMGYAFDSWNPSIMDYCIDHGCDPQGHDALAQALCERIRTALGVYKRYHHRFPDFQRQLNIALRYHTDKHSQKWVALTLWAGADPHEQGPVDVQCRSHYDDYCAIEIALQDRWDWFFEQKAVRLNPRHASAKEIFRSSCCVMHGYRFEDLIDAGYADIFSHEEQNKIFEEMLWYMQRSCPQFTRSIEMLSVLFERGWHWMPEFDTLRSLRRTLINFGGTNLIALLELIRRYRQTSCQILHELIRTATMQGQLKAHRFDPDKYLKSITW